MTAATKKADDVLHMLWLLYRAAIAKHIDTDKIPASTEAAYRESAEKAGIVAVVAACKAAFK